MPTMKQAAKFALIAKRLRLGMSEKGLTNKTLADQFPDRKAFQSNLNVWLGARGAPGPKYRDKLAKLLDIPSAQLISGSSRLEKPSSTALMIREAKDLLSTKEKPTVKSGHEYEPLIVITLSRDGIVNITLKGNTK